MIFDGYCGKGYEVFKLEKSLLMYNSYSFVFEIMCITKNTQIC